MGTFLEIPNSVKCRAGTGIVNKGPMAMFLGNKFSEETKAKIRQVCEKFAIVQRT